jgi:hypothetical protein
MQRVIDRRIAFTISSRPAVVALFALLLNAWIVPIEVSADTRSDENKATTTEALLVQPDRVNEQNLAAWRKDGFSAIALILDERFEASLYVKAADAMRANSLDLYYWIEVGRNPAFADAHPQWMASFGMHEDWRRLFPDARQPKEDEVIKVWPWTPIYYQEAFDAHLARIQKLLTLVPKNYRGLLLNDLQGGPSACGCGNLQCRWAIDYGVPSTAKVISAPNVASRFVAEVEKLSGGKTVIPVWTTECEQQDMAPDKVTAKDFSTGYCGDVDCFNTCRTKFNEQWTALHATHLGPTGLLLLHKEFQRDRKEYGVPANWLSFALEYVDQQKPQSTPRHKLWLVVQGYDVTIVEEAAARTAARQSGAGAILVARTRIDQSFEPRFVKVRAK